MPITLDKLQECCQHELELRGYRIIFRTYLPCPTNDLLVGAAIAWRRDRHEDRPDFYAVAGSTEEGVYITGSKFRLEPVPYTSFGFLSVYGLRPFVDAMYSALNRARELVEGEYAKTEV